MKDEIIRKQEELIEYSVSILRGLYPLLMIDSSKCIEKILIRLESNLAELKEQQPEQTAKNMKILSEMANQDELLADMELEQSAEEILYKHTCCINPYKKEDILDAMQEYRQQGMSTEDEINVYFDKLFREGRLSKREINNRVEGAKYVLNKWKENNNESKIY